MTNPITRTLSMSLLSELVGHVDVLHPTTESLTLGPRLGAATSKIDLDNCPPVSYNTSVATGTITPTCLQELYGIPSTPATQRNNALLVTGYVGEYAQATDLAVHFLKLLRPDIPATTTFTVLSADNETSPQDLDVAGREAGLDIQYIAGVATRVPVQFLSRLHGPRCTGNIRGLRLWRCLRGGHDDNSVCNVTDFIPVFPAAYPFVTSVGSMQNFGPEVAVNFTSGGYSNIFPAPRYQSAAIDGFIKVITADFAGTFNKTRRGYPDVATQGWNFEFVDIGKTNLAGGSSASSPTFAEIIGLINARLLAERKPTLGFLNPFLYSKASNAFTNIMIGHNSGFICPPLR
ncbi:peptidase S8/S53 domain-containing protein [Mycena epipterygia]|nr:peptidase S8/S53 domain-containing protein [Mycena epipterygia]